jgi:hypothetical protein
MTAVATSAADDSWAVSFDAPAATAAHAPPRCPLEANFRLPGAKSIPASAILPRIGERVRLDTTFPPHPRGTGLKWPPEATVDLDFGSGRMPLEFAWLLAEKSKSWRWYFGNEEYELSPYDALAAGVREMLPVSAMAGGDRRIAVVIPNHWNETQQQKLLDALHAEGVAARLIWRSIAAALAWAQLCELQIGAAPRLRLDCSQKLLVLYLGMNCFELTVLDLVPRQYQGEMLFLPGRKRPHHEGRLATALGYRASLLKLLQRHPGLDSAEDVFATIWRMHWTTDWLTSDCVNLVIDHRSNASKVGSLDPNVVSALFAGSVDGTWNDALQWCHKWSEHLRKEPIVAATIIGPLAQASLESGKSVARCLLSALGRAQLPCLTEGTSGVTGVLARGAAIYASGARLGRPTYLDTLPRLKTAVTRNGEPCWIDLLTDEHQFVDGGQVWRRAENVRGLALSKDSHDLTLAVCHEEFTQVRTLSADLPRAVKRREAVSIAVTVEPAQGNARLEVLPENSSLFERRRVVFDWRRMKELPFNDQEYIDSLPRLFPDILPRSGSSLKWREARRLMIECTHSLTTGRAPVHLVWELGAVRTALQQKDTGYGMRDVTAIGSDGVPCDNQATLDEFVKAAFERIRVGDEILTQHLIRALAYTSTDYPPFLMYLCLQLAQDRTNADQALVTACGWCFRDPAHIECLAECAERKLQTQGTGQYMWWKALSEALRYRTDATREISNVRAERLTTLALNTFKTKRLQRSGDLLFRYVCLVIVYLLRRRAYEDAYLDPESKLANTVKGEFKCAIKEARQGTLRLVGGSVNLAEQLQFMIDYVDRRGRGQLVLDV